MTGVILIGGKSSRMGQEKALMSVGGVPVFQRILDVFEKLFDEILIVTDREGRFAGYGYPEVVDLVPDRGPLGGIYTGLHYAKSDSIFAASCDLPFIHPFTVEFLIKEAGIYDIVVPDIGGRLHPLHASYSKRCLPYLLERIENNLLNITGFINDIQGLSIRRIEMQEFAREDTELRALFNMNTEEDWVEANRIAEKRIKPCVH